MNMELFKKRLMRAVGLASAILEVVEEMGDEGSPEGTLYASVMSCYDVHEFQEAVGVLIKAGRVRRENHTLFPVPEVVQ